MNCYKTIKNRKTVPTKPFGATKATLERYHLPSHELSVIKIHGIKDKNNFLPKRYTPEQYFPTFGILTGEITWEHLVEQSLITYLVHYFVLFPIARICFINGHYFISKQRDKENAVRRLVLWGSVSDFIHVVVAGCLLGFGAIEVEIAPFCLIDWSFIVHWDLVTFVFLAFTTVIIAIIGSNFLGFPDHKVQVLHHYKRDTLHLRWVQKHT